MTFFFKILLTILLLTSCSEQDAKTYFEGGRQKLEKGDFAGAIKDFNRAVKLNPHNKSAFYFKTLSEKQLLWDYKNSIEDLNKIIEINPNDDLAYNQRAKFKFMLGDKDGAIDDLNNLIKINPNYANAYINRGRVRFAVGDVNAIDDFNKSIELNPNSFSSYTERARFKLGLGDKNGAKADYNKVLEIKGTSKDIEFYQARAEMKFALDDKDGAIVDYYKALDKALETKEASKNSEFCASIYATIGNIKGLIIQANKSSNYTHKDVIMDFDKAIKVYPKSMYLLQQRGITKYLSGDSLGAVEDFKKIIETQDGDISRVELSLVYYHKALAEMDLKNYESALDDFNKVLEIEPNNADAILKRKFIKEGTCSAKLVKTSVNGYSKSFYIYLPNKACNIIDSATSKKNKTLLTSILNQLKQDKFYKENCPRCSIDIYTDMEVLEYDYKIMNWVSLGIDQCSYNKLRHDGIMQRLLRKHLVLSFNDFQYGSKNGEEILTYPCQKNGYCENSTEIPKLIRHMCNF